MKKFLLFSLCLFANLHSAAGYTPPYPQIQETYLLKDGTRVLIKEQDLCLQPDDPEIVLLSQSFPLNTHENFTIAHDAQGFSHYFDCLNAYVHVADKEVLCGTMLYIPLPQINTVIIEFLAVEPAYQKKGVGKALIICLEEAYTIHDYKKISLQATNSSREFYNKLGYTSLINSSRFEKNLTQKNIKSTKQAPSSSSFLDPFYIFNVFK